MVKGLFEQTYPKRSDLRFHFRKLHRNYLFTGILLLFMINFNVELDGFKLTERKKKKDFLKTLVKNYGFKLGELNYIFLSDEDLLQVNIDYLNHNTYTDIITFDNSDDDKTIEGDIFVSVDRIKENAEKFKVEFENEFIRVLSHGVLHLIGFKDKTEEEALKMRKAEEEALQLYFQIML